MGMKRPLTLQARLMTAVIGFVSLILIIVAVITSATLGTALEGQLAEQVRTLSIRTTNLVTQASIPAAVRNTPLTARGTMENVAPPRHGDGPRDRSPGQRRQRGRRERIR